MKAGREGAGMIATDLLDQIKSRVRKIEPGAKAILFGSRARGDAAADSDWDLLFLLDGVVDRHRRRSIRDALLEIELETGQVLSPLVMSRLDWDRDVYPATPVHDNIAREGIVL